MRIIVKSRRTESLTLSHYPAKFGCHKCLGCVKIKFSIFFSGNHVFTWRGGRGSLSNLSYYPAKFWDYSWSESPDKTFFNCHMTARSKTPVTGWCTSILSYHSSKFGSLRWCGSPDIRFFLCHVTTWSKGCVIWWVGSPHLMSPPFQFWCF